MGRRNNKKLIIESRIRYDEKHDERIHPIIVDDLRKREHALGSHPAFPESDELHFEEKIASKRFNNLVKHYKRIYDVSSVSVEDALMNTMSNLHKCIKFESEHVKELEELAVKLVRKEFEIPEDELKIIAKISPKIDIQQFKEHWAPRDTSHLQFESHDDITNANQEVTKRRLINSMIQGASKKCSHMFHLVEDEINEINPRLNNSYSKMVAGADLCYYLLDEKTIKPLPGGVVNVEYGKSEDNKPTIYATGNSFPILVHEIVKGVMEIISSHGLPENETILEYVYNKADYTGAEFWDMRLGPGIWEQFLECFEVEDLDLKHHVYQDVVSLPVNEFNHFMKEILSGTNKGKRLLKEFCERIREQIRKDDLNYSILNDDVGDDDELGPDELDDLDIDSLFN